MNIVAVETATEACSAALWIDGEIREQHERAPNLHSSALLPMVERLLQEAGLSLGDCDAVAFGTGPGSFTGLRIGVGVAQGLAFGAEIPTVPISSLQALAQRHTGEHVLAAFDARMSEVYWCPFRREQAQMVPAGPARVDAPGAVRVPPRTDWTGVGSGWDRYPDALRTALAPGTVRHIAGSHPHAAEVARLAAWRLRAGVGMVPPEAAAPDYVRQEVAKRPGDGRLAE